VLSEHILKPLERGPEKLVTFRAKLGSASEVIHDSLSLVRLPLDLIRLTKGLNQYEWAFVCNDKI
jgi:hypothetical protein